MTYAALLYNVVISDSLQNLSQLRARVSYNFTIYLANQENYT